MVNKTSMASRMRNGKKTAHAARKHEVADEVQSDVVNQNVDSGSDVNETDEVDKESEESEIEGFESDQANDSTSDNDSDNDSDVQIENGSHTMKKLDPKKLKDSNSKSGKKDKYHDLSGIIYVSRLPLGFNERELNKYFSQFGDLKQLRLARNKKTGNSRHYGFIEFVNKEDAIVAQEAMDNYLILGHLLKVKVLPKGKKIEKLFRYKQKPFRKTKISRSSEQLKASAKEKHQERLDKLKEAGIDFKW